MTEKPLYQPAQEGYKDFLPHIHNSDFRGAVVSASNYYLNGRDGAFQEAVRYFKDLELTLSHSRQLRTITFDSGASILFSCPNSIWGMQLSSVMIINSTDLTEYDILKCVSRVRRGYEGERFAVLKTLDVFKNRGVL